jgi:uncharacterized protein YciI
MQFLIVALDHKDSSAPARRQAARAAHLKLGEKMIERGELLYAAAILDDSSQMIGSMMVTDFNSREDLDSWLQAEPYVTQKVWDQIDIKACRPGPSFIKQPRA